MICKKCGFDKWKEEFYSNDTTCKDCRKEQVRKNRAEKADYYRAYDAMRYKNDPKVKDRHKRYLETEKGIAAATRAKTKWTLQNPIKRLASHSINNAVRDGKLQKPSLCSECGKSGRIHGHHDDYAFPLVVRWLCSKCHISWHKEHGEGLNA